MDVEEQGESDMNQAVCVGVAGRAGRTRPLQIEVDYPRQLGRLLHLGLHIRASWHSDLIIGTPTINHPERNI